MPSPVVKLSSYGRNFAWLVRAVANGEVDEGGAAGWAAAHGAPRDVVEVLRAGVPAASTSSGNWAGDLLGDAEGYAAIVGDFTATLSAGSAFFRLFNAGALSTVPSYSQAAVITTDVSSAIANVAEGKPLKVASMVVARDKIAPVKAGVIVAATDELMKAAPAAGGLFERMLRQAAGISGDKRFFSAILNGLSGSAATSDALADVRTLAAAVDCKGGDLYWIAGTTTIRLLATAKASGSAELLFEGDVGLQGGELLGRPIIVSEGCAADSLILLNAGQIAASLEGVFIDRARHASIEMDSAPAEDSTTSTGADLVNLWQSNMTAIRVVVSLAAARMRDSAVKEVTSCAWAA